MRVKLRHILLAATLTGIASSPVGESLTAAAQQQQQTTTARKRRAKTTARQKSPSGRNSAKKQAPAKKQASGKRETAADVKKRQVATQKEIRLTEEQIKENERSVKAGLNQLGKLQGDINVSKGRIATTSKQISTLNGQISSLEKNISANEAELRRMRDEYLKALKKMRLSRKRNSGLAFIFASENFSQALRRMRYLRQFSAWKDRQCEAIGHKNAQLSKEKSSLGQARSRHDEALKRQQAEQSALTKQYSQQDAIVAGLKKNGAALKSHLSKKQAEANDLRNRIAALIAEEERKAAEERRAEEERQRKEAARKAEEERLAREEAAREEAARLEAQKEEEARREAQALAEKARRMEKERKEAEAAAERAAKEEREAEKKMRKEKQKAAEQAKRKAEEAQRKEKEAQRKEKEARKKAEEARKKAESSASYAEARKRKPRSQGNVESSPAASGKASAQSPGNFGSMKGSLPRPVSGSFKVTSRFGRQSLPDLPDVVYDNPGIDAEVSAGASATAVYAGKVSGVYMLPGYNTVVIVNHGNYYTVYGNIMTAAVKVGDQVKAGQGLGKLAPDEDDRSRSSIHFEVWRNRDKLNPLEWIK